MMKAIRIFSLGAICLALTTMALGQTTSETFKVSGNCGMCKSTIEKAAKAGGAQTASWDKETKVLTVTYLSSSTNTAKIQQKIAAAGYDNVGFRATDESYNKLHSCCKYDRDMAKETMADSRKGADKMECAKDGKMDCCKDGKMENCKNGDMAKCKDGDMAKCKDMSCCKDGKCTKPGHEGEDCCKSNK